MTVIGYIVPNLVHILILIPIGHFWLEFGKFEPILGELYIKSLCSCGEEK